MINARDIHTDVTRAFINALIAKHVWNLSSQSPHRDLEKAWDYVEKSDYADQLYFEHINNTHVSDEAKLIWTQLRHKLIRKHE